MLLSITTPPAAGDIITVKLTNGEEIMARLKNVEGDNYFIETPVSMQLVPTGNGQAGVTFVPFLMGLGDESGAIEISYSKMLHRPIKSRDDAMKQYIRSTSGIEL